MNQARVIGLVALAIGASTLATTVHAAVGQQSKSRPNVALCGGNLWRMKTLSDVGRHSVRLLPRDTTIGAILQRGTPRPTPRFRRTPFQRQTWAVPAQITRYWREGNELRLQLFDHGSYMNVVVPGPSCMTGATRARGAITATWTMFMNRCGHATANSQPLGAVVIAVGVGFWSQRRTRHGEARNGAELHPLTALRPVAGCGS